MSGMADQIAQRMRDDGVDTHATVADAVGGSSAEGTDGGRGDDRSSAGTQNTDRSGPPDSIPYSRFTEVNSQLQALRPYEELVRLGISPDSAVRLANFELAYSQDPMGTIASLLDSQDLPGAQKTALKALLKREQADEDAGADDEGGSDSKPAPLPAEVTEALGYIKELRQREQQQDTQNRLDVMIRHWQQLDEADGIEAPERQKLMYIQSAAGSGITFQTLEAMAEAARASFLEDRDITLGSAVQRRETGRPQAVPFGGLPPTGAVPAPRSMKEARKRIEADMAAGRLPDLSPGT